MPVVATLAGLAAVAVLGAGAWWMLGRPATPAATVTTPAPEPTRVAEPPVAAPAPAPAPEPTPTPAPPPAVATPAPTAEPPAEPPAAAPVAPPRVAPAPVQATAPAPRPAAKPVAKSAGNDPRCADLLQLMSLGQDIPALRERMAQYKCQ